MAVAKSNSSPSSTLCSDCCKVGSLIDTVLDSNQSSSFEHRYLLGEQLGWGQFGIIRLCSDRLTGEVFACKSIAKDRLVTPDDLCSVKLEIEIMTKLSGHPNVVALKAVYEEQDYVHLVMELCAGGELFHRLEKQGRFPESHAQVLFKHLMEVVMYCHDKGIVHRDLKPENILLATKSPSSPIKLADFGLATYIKPGQNLHGTVGSPFYIAPEVLAGGYNEAADVWSAGVILYILLSGMPPFWGKTKSRIFDAVRAADLHFPANSWHPVSASAKDLIIRMLCRDPARRLTAAQVLDHAWMKSYTQLSEEPSVFANPNCKQLELSCASFSTTLISGNRDISFESRSPGPSSLQLESSPAFTCKSSFSSFLVEATPLSTASGVFSFRSCSGTNSVEFSSPVFSPSFTFFSPASPNDKEDQTIFPTNKSILNSIQRELQRVASWSYLSQQFMLSMSNTVYNSQRTRLQRIEQD
ncbi:calcium-dependent protein kinase 5-like isoform X2 [Aristolochia californica]|uniref:calcium-dependent protein kinase 5-like isoform X2 n=1 Tax=Aristolochia californica TaxID=171875 RepID=UPI0035E14722